MARVWTLARADGSPAAMSGPFATPLALAAGGGALVAAANDRLFLLEGANSQDISDLGSFPTGIVTDGVEAFILRFRQVDAITLDNGGVRNLNGGAGGDGQFVLTGDTLYFTRSGAESPVGVMSVSIFGGTVVVHATDEAAFGVAKTDAALYWTSGTELRSIPL
jgi:hypothetical protein